MNERDRAMLGVDGAEHYHQALREAAERASVWEKNRTVVPAEEMEWESSRQGRIKHMVNEAMRTRESVVDMYQQLIEPGGHSGKHRHFSEEVLFVLEGHGYDLHWDPIFGADVRYEWRWETTPKRFDWGPGDFIYVPPYATHQHFAAGERVRMLSATSRVVKAMGFDGLEQLEDASSWAAEV